MGMRKNTRYIKNEMIEALKSGLTHPMADIAGIWLQLIGVTFWSAEDERRFLLAILHVKDDYLCMLIFVGFILQCFIGDQSCLTYEDDVAYEEGNCQRGCNEFCGT